MNVLHGRRTASWTACLLIAAGCNRDSASPEKITTAPAPQAQEQTAPSADGTANSDPVAQEAAATPVVSGRSRAAWETLSAPGVSPDEWEAAQRQLVELQAESVPVLVEGLRSDDAMQREMAAALMMQLPPDVPGTAEPLLRALGDSSQYVRANAATALCMRPGHEEQVIPVLAALLTSDDPQLRELAAMNLNNFGPEAAACVPILTEALHRTPSESIRPIVELLGRIGPAAEAARPRLQQIAFEQEGDAREAATAALQQIGPAN